MNVRREARNKIEANVEEGDFWRLARVAVLICRNVVLLEEAPLTANNEIRLAPLRAIRPGTRRETAANVEDIFVCCPSVSRRS